MTPEERKELHWLTDMREAIRKIEEHPKIAEGRIAFDADEHFRIWVLFHLERIGECASRLRREHDYDALHPEIDWQGTQAMRRILVHSYWNTDYGKVWQGVEYLRKIKEKLDGLLGGRHDEPRVEKDGNAVERSVPGSAVPVEDQLREPPPDAP